MQPVGIHRISLVVCMLTGLLWREGNRWLHLLSGSGEVDKLGDERAQVTLPICLHTGYTGPPRLF